jgi:glutathione S-transferase
MKLYYATGTCSLAPHIVVREAGLPLDLERVDIQSQPHRTETGVDFTEVNPKGYVPVLRLDDGQVLTEGVAIMQYLADLAPGSGLAPAPGTPERYRLQEWLSFISSELHKMFSPWLFHPEHGELPQEAARARIKERFAFLDHHLEAAPHLMGERFTAADAYAFTIVGWSRFARIELRPYPNLTAYMERVGAWPGVQAAVQAESLSRAAS